MNVKFLIMSVATTVLSLGTPTPATAAPAVAGTLLIGKDNGTNNTTLHLGKVQDGGAGEKGTGGAGGAGGAPGVSNGKEGGDGGNGGQGGNGGHAGNGEWTITGSFTNRGTVRVGGDSGKTGGGGSRGANGSKGGAGGVFLIGNGANGEDATGFPGSGGKGGIILGAGPTAGVTGGGGGGGQSTVTGASGGQGVGSTGARGAGGTSFFGQLQTLTTSGTFTNAAAGIIEIGPSGGNAGQGGAGGNGGGGGGGPGGGLFVNHGLGGPGGSRGSSGQQNNTVGAPGNGQLRVGANGVFTNQNLAKVEVGGMTNSPILGFGAFTIQSGGTLDNQAGGSIKLKTIKGIMNIDAGGMVVNNGTIDVSAGSSGRLTNHGTFSGSGRVIGNFDNRGVFAPGNSPGFQTIDGDYTENGTLDIEIGGLIAGTEYDYVNVLGNVTLGNATLDLSVFGGFDVTGLNLGDEFDIIQYTGSQSGTFNSVNQSAVSPAMFAVDYTNDGSVTLRVVAIPEPGTHLLLLFGSFLLVARLARQKKRRNKREI